MSQFQFARGHDRKSVPDTTLYYKLSVFIDRSTAY